MILLSPVYNRKEEAKGRTWLDAYLNCDAGRINRFESTHVFLLIYRRVAFVMGLLLGAKFVTRLTSGFCYRTFFFYDLHMLLCFLLVLLLFFFYDIAAADTK